MSSRALRKFQREQEQKQQQAISEQNSAQDEESEEEVAPAPKALNAFDMLNEDEGDEDVEAEILSNDEFDGNNAESGILQEVDKPSISEKPRAKSKPKKKKKKGKAVEKGSTTTKNSESTGKTEMLDEIDLALKSLSTKIKDDPSVSTRVTIDEANVHLYRLLAVESRHLNALNEMKRLFGNVVLENDDENVGTPRRRGRGPQQLDLGGALAGRNNPASRGQGLVGLALRRNPFILGKEEWPKATSGGLGMEMVEKMEDATVEYRFVHNTIYEDVQRQFETCVESMDPQRMISMLQYNPYHISTLLQVSEIAKQQGDHSVSGDLLERALFSFGRSVHSSFTTALSEGKARLDFRRPENREFWLTAWRYTNNLGQRGTWRTAYEWTKLILSLDPKGDPYCVGLMIDQIALRGGQAEHFLQLSRCSFFRDDLWVPRPNIRISSALAEYKLKQAQVSRASLTKCINGYPWIFARLFQDLNIDHIPKSIWGKTPPSDRDRFECELYVHNARDLWNTPEAVSLLVEVAESADDPTKFPRSKEDITLDEARHVLLSGVPTLINLIPRAYTTMSSSSSDPLPPPDNLPSYDPAPPKNSHREYESPFEAVDGTETPPNEGTPNPRSPEDNEREVAQEQQLEGAAGFWRRLLPWMATGEAPNPLDVENAENRMRDEQTMAAQQGVPPELTGERQARLMELMEQLRPRAATVESDPDEGSPGNEARPQPLASTTPPIEPSKTPEPYDDDRNQRWLAGQGKLRLKDYTDQHGTDEHAWAENSGQDIVVEYATRMLQLRQQRTRDFLMDFTLPQGTSVEVKKLIVREIERQKQ